jgi:beta-lactamase regulating signal transducer with metallopeptidase domain/tetratricopeptide (TPR) repeat protein
MTTQSIIPSAAWSAAGWTMVHLTWVGVVLGTLGAVLRRLLGKSSPEVRYGLSVAVLAMMSAAPIILFTWLYEPSESPRLLAPKPTLQLATQSISDRAARPVATGFGMPAIGAVSSSRAIAEPAPRRLEAIVAGLPMVWIAGSCLTSLLLGTGLLGTRALRRTSCVISEGEAHAMALRLAKSLGMVRRFGIGVCQSIASPVLVGIIRPLILLPPAALAGWTADELEMALLHELAHLRRHDNLVNLWQSAVEALLFFHPITWWLSAWVRLERERSCDRTVVSWTGKPRPYAEMLAALAGASPRRLAISALAERPVVSRIRTILNMEEKHMRLTLPEGLGLVGASLFALATALVAFAGTGPTPGTGSTSVAKRAALRALARRAAEVTIDSPGLGDQGETLLEIARAQFKVGDREAAAETVRRAEQSLEAGSHQAKIPPIFAACVTRARVADTWQAFGDARSARASLDRATAELTSMIDPKNREQTVRAANLVPEAAGMGDPVDYVVAELSTPIIEQRIQLGDLEEARKLIAWSVEACKGVKAPLRPLVSAAFASLLARAGDPRQARSLAIRAEQESQLLAGKERARARRSAARALAECGELDLAFPILKEQAPKARESAAIEILDGFQEYDPDELTGWLDPAGFKILIGTRGTKPKGPPGGLAALAARFRDLDDAKVKARSLSTIALLLAKAGQHGAALTATESIPALSRRDDPGPSDGFYDSVKPGTFALIAASMARAGDQPGAARAFGRSAALTRAIDSPAERLIALIVLAGAYADTQDRPAAAAVVREGVELAKVLPEPRRSRGLVMLIRAQARAGDPAGAVPTINSLREYPGVEKSQALMGLAHAFQKAGDEAAARAMASEAMECTKPQKPEGLKLGAAMRVDTIGRDTFLDPDLEFDDALTRFHLIQIADQARIVLNTADAERAARAKPSITQTGVLGGRNMALGTLATKLAYKGQLDEAMRIAASIEEPHDKLLAYQQLARAIRGGDGG